MLNTASAGKFSSDRTIEEYVRDIWKLEKVYPVPEEEVAPVAAQTKTTARKTAARKSKKADAQPAKGKDQQGR
jgi:starch phosphorylase